MYRRLNIPTYFIKRVIVNNLTYTPLNHPYIIEFIFLNEMLPSMVRKEVRKPATQV